jgi:hypothetical protein
MWSRIPGLRKAFILASPRDSDIPKPEPPRRLGLHVGASFVLAAIVAGLQGYLQGRGYYAGLSVAAYLTWAVITLIVAWGSSAIIRGGKHEALAFGFVLLSVILLFLLTGVGWRLGFHQELDARLDVEQLNEWAALVAARTNEISEEPILLPLQDLPPFVTALWRRPPTRVEVLNLFLGQETAVIDIRWRSGLFVHGLLLGSETDIRRYNELGSKPIAAGIHFYRWLE